MKYRLLETTNGWKIIDQSTQTTVYENSATTLPISELDLPAMYQEIKDATGIEYDEIEDGFTGHSI